MVASAKEKQREEAKPQTRQGLRLQKELMIGNFRTGMLGFGGGPSSIPLFQQEAVKKYKWMTEEEFADTLALANTMPGPIATKMAGYIGYRVGGIVGLINALVSSVLPTVIILISLLQVLQAYKDIPWVKHMSASIVPVVAVMLAQMTWEFVKKSGTTLGWKKAIILILASFLLTEVTHLHPGILIMILIISVFIPFKRKENPS